MNNPSITVSVELKIPEEFTTFKINMKALSIGEMK